MPLTTHTVAALVCVAAAGVMLAGARDRTVRAAHLVVLAAMTLLLVAMHSVPVVLGSALVLAVTAARLVRRPGHEVRHCALDTAVTGGLVMLMGVPLVLATTGHGGVPAAGEHGVHARLHAVVPGQVDHQLVLGLVALALLVAWTVGHRRLPGRAGSRPVGVARWAMMLAMGAMVATV